MSNDYVIIGIVLSSGKEFVACVDNRYPTGDLIFDSVTPTIQFSKLFDYEFFRINAYNPIMVECNAHDDVRDIIMSPYLQGSNQSLSKTHLIIPSQAIVSYYSPDAEIVEQYLHFFPPPIELFAK